MFFIQYLQPFFWWYLWLAGLALQKMQTQQFNVGQQTIVPTTQTQSSKITGRTLFFLGQLAQ